MTPHKTPATLSVVLLASAVMACASQARSSRPAETGPTTSSVSETDIQNQPGQPIEKVLANRVSGVDVAMTPDGFLSVRIRGASTVMGSSEPLYVIDGVPITPGPNGALMGINPGDIESIRVLKDAANTAMYGSRGANGVIVIKLKKAGH